MRPGCCLLTCCFLRFSLAGLPSSLPAESLSSLCPAVVASGRGPGPGPPHMLMVSLCGGLSLFRCPLCRVWTEVCPHKQEGSRSMISQRPHEGRYPAGVREAWGWRAGWRPAGLSAGTFPWHARTRGWPRVVLWGKQAGSTGVIEPMAGEQGGQ